MASDGRPERIFLVGFPRSGTTLLQALVGAHPQVATFPETFFFIDLAPGGRRRRLLGLPGPKARGRFEEAATRVTAASGPSRVGDPARLRLATAGMLAKRFCHLLDQAARQDGKLAWVEKTPSHLHRVDDIERYVPDSKFVHIVRSGEAAIASLYAVTQEHPAQWGGSRSFDRCVARWREDLRRSYRCADRGNHAFVSYEQLVDEPEVVLEGLVRWIGLSSDRETIETMLRGYRRQVSSVAVEEPWKDSVSAAIANRNDARLDQLLSPGEQEHLTRLLTSERRLAMCLPFISGQR